MTVVHSLIQLMAWLMCLREQHWTGWSPTPVLVGMNWLESEHVPVKLGAGLGMFLPVVSKTCSIDLYSYNLLELYNVLLNVYYSNSNTSVFCYLLQLMTVVHSLIQLMAWLMCLREQHWVKWPITPALVGISWLESEHVPVKLGAGLGMLLPVVSLLT